MGPRTCTSFWCASLILLTAGRAAACSGDAQPLFVCETERAGKYIEICANEDVPGEKWSNIQYGFGPEDKNEFVYPSDPAKGAQLLYFSHSESKEGYRVQIRFVNGGYTYIVYSVALSEMEGEAGVEVRDKNGKLKSRIGCIERPYMFPDYLRRALTCDPQNLFGKRGCEYTPPKSK